jgi:uncharacterized protein (DUF885 family)
MTTRASALAACLSICLVSACATTPQPAAIVTNLPDSAEPSASERDALFALFRASDEDSLARSPISAILRGDLRYAESFGDYISDDYIAAERAAAQRDIAALRAIDRSKLSPTDQLAYDAFEWQINDSLRGLEPDILALTKVRPMNHFFGFHTFYPTFASGQGGAPFKTLQDYENNLKRHNEYVIYLDRVIERFREGQKAGVVETKMTVRNMIEQLDNQLDQQVEDSPFYGPVANFPDEIDAADRERLTAQYRAAITDDLFPALRRLRDYLHAEYLPDAREGHGLVYMKGGDALYAHQLESMTTLPLTAVEIHELGLGEVARITGEFETVKNEVGFTGTLKQFFEHIRTSPKFRPESREALTQAYYEVAKKVEPLLPQFFSTFPKAQLEIRPYEPFREKFEAGGSYEQGTPDGSRPGIFYFNAYDLPSRSTTEITTLYLHEGAPGHHFQISLAQENEALPDFLRFGGNTAYVEGWALYAETLGYPMGLYEDPYQRFGTLNDEMLRAMRLVVDTGIHSKGWSREQAIEYMLSHSGMGITDATAEVERYIAIPSQATAYKVGALTIQRLRAEAESRLGDKFDIREFHAQVLDTGALPLPVLEAKIDRWIASRQAQ